MAADTPAHVRVGGRARDLMAGAAAGVADLTATHVHEHPRQVAATLRAAAAIVAVHATTRPHLGRVADQLDDLAARVAPPRTTTDDQEDR